MRLFDGVKRKELGIESCFDKEEVIRNILEERNDECPNWRFFRIFNKLDSSFDALYCDFIVVYTDSVNREIELKENPFSQYKKIVPSIYQIVLEVIIADQDIFDWDSNDQQYKRIFASSSKQLFRQLKTIEESWPWKKGMNIIF